MDTTRNSSAGSGAEDHLTARTQGFEARTLTASGSPLGAGLSGQHRASVPKIMIKKPNRTPGCAT